MKADKIYITVRLSDHGKTGKLDSEVLIFPPDGEITSSQWHALKACIEKTLELEKPNDCTKSLSNSTLN